MSHIKRAEDTGDDDDMEIVVVSDTVRQRRSRTPSASSALPNESQNIETKTKTSEMPDVLPKTFHLAEKSALFSQIDSTPNVPSQPNPIDGCEQKVSIVEIREANLSTPKRAINTYNVNQSYQCENIGQILNTCSILESVSYLQPSCVETVNIIDVTSEPSDSETCCSTPNPSERRKLSSDDEDGDDDDDDDEGEEYETGEPAPPLDTMQILKRQISYDEHWKSLRKDRDLLKDSEHTTSEKNAPKKWPRKKLTPTLKEILSGTTDCDRTDSADTAEQEEPLIFSDDDDDDEQNQFVGPTTEQFNRHTVLIEIEISHPNKNQNQFLKIRQKKSKIHKFISVADVLKCLLCMKLSINCLLID